MKIKINEKNREAINAALDHANGKATAHTFTSASSIMAAARDAEDQLTSLCIPKVRRAGASAYAMSGREVARSYDYSRIVTGARIWRGAAAWYLVSLHSCSTHDRTGGRTFVTLTAEQDVMAVAQFRRGYNVNKELTV
jgi:hypothetical protein